MLLNSEARDIRHAQCVRRRPFLQLRFAATGPPSPPQGASGQGRPRATDREPTESRHIGRRDRQPIRRISIKHMRNLVRKILAERMPQPPAEYLALQVSRLNEALLVSYSAMHNSATGTNFEAVDRVVRIVRELDRYHGFAALPRPREESEPLRLPPPLRARSRSGLRSARGSKLAPQVIENARFGLANGRSVRSVVIADVRMRKRLSRAAPGSSSRRSAGVRVTISCRTTRRAPSPRARPPIGPLSITVALARAARSGPARPRTEALSNWERAAAAAGRRPTTTGSRAMSPSTKATAATMSAAVTGPYSDASQKNSAAKSEISTIRKKIAATTPNAAGIAMRFAAICTLCCAYCCARPTMSFRIPPNRE